MIDERDKERVKAALASDVPRLLTALGMKYRREGSGWKVLCPVHSERTPSCRVDVQRGALLWRCHGCGAGGDAIKLVGAVDGLRDFPEMARRAAAYAGIHLEDVPRDAPMPPPAPRPPPPPPEPPPCVDCFDLVARTLLELCPLAGDVAEYLERRGVLQEARADGWGALPPGREQGRVLGELRRRCDGAACPCKGEPLATSGLLQQDGRAFTWTEHRLLIPWRTPGVAGLIYAIQRRTLDPTAPAGQKYVFPRGRSLDMPYGCDAWAEADLDAPIAYVEGAIDALARRRLDRERGASRVVLGLPGVQNRKPGWAALARGRVAYIAFDADAAGEREIHAAALELYAAGASKVIHLEPLAAKDWTGILEQRTT